MKAIKQESNKIAALLIVKGVDSEAQHLRRCLESISGYIDGIFLNINYKSNKGASVKVLQVAQDFNAEVLLSEWHDDFSEARNANLEQVSKDFDWIIWLDADDTIDKPEKIRKVAEASVNFDSIYADYLYDRDEAGNPTTVHMVARMFQNNNSHRWKGRIHETLIETRSARQAMTKDFMVIHHAEAERTVESFNRNIRLLEKQVEDEKKDPDPRTYYYLGVTYMDSGEMKNAKELLHAYLEMSGWDQERSVAHTKLGRIYLGDGDKSQAKAQFMLGIGEDPANSEPRVELASLEIEMGQFLKAKDWLEGVEKMEKNPTTLEVNPMTHTFRTYLLLAECYLNIGGKELDKALEYARKALKYKKKDSQVKAYVKTIEQVVEDKHLTENFLRVYKRLQKNGEEAKLDSLLEAVPKQLDDNPIIVKLRNKDPYTWPKKSIVIMTGDTALDAWGPWSLRDGIGGSEEAIIRLAPKLAQLGYKVVVFGKPGANSGLIENVMWRNYWECNLDDEFDIFISWRAPFIFDKTIKARKSYLWMHDVMEPGEFTEGRLANLHKVILLSNYHRSLFPMIPEEKVLLSGNAIDPEDFDQYDGKLRRDPHKMIYASSHVRGLAYLYEIWPEIKKAVPEATLDVYYGRESYDKVHRGNPERMKWMDDMIAKAKNLKGVTDHGKASQDKIVEETFRSGVWAYPCLWPEIYCITAVKSQAGGAIPVTTDFAAIDETVKFGIKVHGAVLSNGGGDYSDRFLKEYKQALIDMLKNPDKQESIRPKMMKWSRTQSWRTIAESWHKDFQL